jgi:hypothetical protein
MNRAAAWFVAWAACAAGCSSGINSARDPRTGIEINFQVSRDVFPAEWLEGDPQFVYGPVPTGERERTVRLVREAMDAYPKHLIKNNLDIVYGFGELGFGGYDYGGTYTYGTLYIVNAGRKKGFTDHWVRGTFHHELSSVLYYNNPGLLDEKEWNKANGEAFEYQFESGEEYSDYDDDQTYKVEHHELGFLSAYGKTSLEEDFNTFAEALFSGEYRFWRIVDEHPRVARKARLVIAFYNELEPSFTEEFFRALAKE